MAEAKRELSPDVNKQELGGIYAKSLLAVAERAGPGKAEAVVSELEDFVTEVLDGRPLFEQFLAAPQIAADHKSRVLEKAFSGRMSSELLTFLQVVAGKGRLDCIREMATQARHQLNALRRRVEVHVKTAAPLDESNTNLLRTKLIGALGGDVALTTSVDPALIGGAVMRIGDTVYDGSVVNRLARLRQHALDTAYSQVQRYTERFTSDK